MAASQHSAQKLHYLRSLRPISHLQFYRAILSHDFIARQNRKCRSTCQQSQTPFPIRAALCSVQLCCENAVNADWSILVYATKLQCATRHVTLAILFCDKVARQNHACDIGLILHSRRRLCRLAAYFHYCDAETLLYSCGYVAGIFLANLVIDASTVKAFKSRLVLVAPSSWIWFIWLEPETHQKKL